MKFSSIKKDCKKIYIILVIICLLFLVYYINNKDMYKNNKDIIDNQKNITEEKISLNEIKANYNDYIKLKDNSIIYIKNNNKYIKASITHGEIEEKLDNTYEIVDEYFKISDSNYYIKYDSIEKIDNLKKLNGEYKYYKNYIPYNENVILNNNAKLYVDDINYYEVNSGSYAILIKDDNRYGIIFNNKLVYVNKDDVLEVVASTNTNEEVTDGISVLNYHFVVSNNSELNECRQIICITDALFDSHIKYLKDNNYYAVSLRDLELFIDGKIQLPKKSVGITIDDGWYVGSSKSILEKYQILGTLFLIGSLASPDDYTSEYLEVHSHSWDMHSGKDCPGIGRGGILCLDREVILEDLRKSRESLDNTTYFCYPFYEYNNRAIELLKEAGFTMAFSGQTSNNKVKVGQDKFRIPRYVIYNYTSMNTFISYIS